jgi:SAM-dependent methyltransferase
LWEAPGRSAGPGSIVCAVNVPGGVDIELRRQLEQSGYHRPGFAEHYDRHRPRPPAALLELVPPLAHVERPRLVVDLGSGTGLSTREWAGRADEVVGVEPNDAMRAWAKQATREPSVRYVAASAYETGLPDACADVVTAAQSLQWMQPQRVFREIARILRPGGVFCAYQYEALQTPLWQPEGEWERVMRRKRELRIQLGLDTDRRRWPITSARLEESGVFRFVREISLHSVESGDGERLVGFALSEGSMTTLLEAGVSEEEVGLDRLRAAAAEMHEPVPWWIGYRVWLGLSS